MKKKPLSPTENDVPESNPPKRNRGNEPYTRLRNISQFNLPILRNGSVPLSTAFGSAFRDITNLPDPQVSPIENSVDANTSSSAKQNSKNQGSLRGKILVPCSPYTRPNPLLTPSGLSAMTNTSQSLFSRTPTTPIMPPPSVTPKRIGG
ncbi:predicted protein [Arabidopsis lyrata subsp. lyrata]|uniref:Predicted protein n=1 Tax=Arabidopsis lyrata subsp. lyrata TaxID=81972 RepID=D7MJM9_ARALL|nr:predicted protein [Arabidopsis lyrata subsp. lyrata]